MILRKKVFTTKTEKGKKVKNLYTHQTFLDDIKNSFGISKENYDQVMETIQLKKESRKICIQRDTFNSMILMSKIFTGFPIYYINTVDYRLRIYPWSYLFSRTTGVYKYLLSDYKSLTLSNEGFSNMLEAYFFPDKDLYTDFLKIKTQESQINFFIHNKIDLHKTKSYIYHTLLEKEINDSLSNGMKTNFMIEVDQRSSSSVFLSIIFKNRKLAEFSNLLNKEEHDIPTYLGTKTRAFCKKNNIQNERIIREFEVKQIYA